MSKYHTNKIAHVNSVELRVLNLQRSIDFYTKTIGLKLLYQSNELTVRVLKGAVARNARHDYMQKRKLE